MSEVDHHVTNNITNTKCSYTNQNETNSLLT
jgi:hypothetical protein